MTVTSHGVTETELLLKVQQTTSYLWQKCFHLPWQNIPRHTYFKNSISCKVKMLLLSNWTDNYCQSSCLKVAFLLLISLLIFWTGMPSGWVSKCWEKFNNQHTFEWQESSCISYSRTNETLSGAWHCWNKIKKGWWKWERCAHLSPIFLCPC